ncbi:regulator of chromosome condensation 1/beta-lactamase-inhibitor protein II [Calycina marina]|uniref:Regulator of chromosome condensation 1/beta-lactamase-inhibitor protein II n=1 Tax=Calycina marina TaxID=1763456 RepID=A0A9P7ZC94_9HELO|nr:regulator of chromosome condensation 1/beta-lactamase-inhibitor protein II [Calycina marina]
MSAIYALGSNGSGQIGIGHLEDVSVPKPVLIDIAFLDPSTTIRAGGNHTLLLSSGNLYAAGDLESGACGLMKDDEPNANQFQEAKLFAENSSQPSIAFCAATWEASVIVTRDNQRRATRVYSFGTGNKGELGHGDFIFRSSKADLIKDFPPGLEIIDLAASVSHVIAVLSNGDVYGWGSGRKGQLGLPEGVIHSPRKVSGLEFKVVRAVCGREFTYLVGDKGDGQHCILGSDKWQVRSAAPADVRGWKEIGATWGSIFVLRETGKLLSWGRDDHGQLAPSDLPLLETIAIGSEHAIGLSTGEEVLAWGWGEHGNCGPNTTDGDIKGRWNVIASSRYLPEGSKISAIGAGCATSWILISF